MKSSCQQTNKRVLILTSPIQQQLVARVNTNKPQIRHYNIIKNCPQLAYIQYLPLILTKQLLKQLNIFDFNLLNYLQNCFSSYKNKPDYSYNYFQTGIVPYTFIHEISKTQKQILINKLDYWKQAGIWGKDVMTPIFQNTWKTILQSANNCYIVADMIGKKQKNVLQYDVYYCLNMYPGHHASQNTYGGYCFLNNAAICAKKLQQNGYNNIAILDLDYHAGDGTQKIFIDDNSIITVSIHADPLLDYPFYSNFQSQSFSNKNIIFSPNTDGIKYLQHVQSAMKFINSHQYDVLIIVFGGDTYQKDPDASQYCKCGLKFQDYKKIGQFIRKKIYEKEQEINNIMKIPIIVTQQGGYNMDDIHNVVYEFLAGLVTKS